MQEDEQKSRFGALVTFRGTNARPVPIRVQGSMHEHAVQNTSRHMPGVGTTVKGHGSVDEVDICFIFVFPVEQPSGTPC